MLNHSKFNAIHFERLNLDLKKNYNHYELCFVIESVGLNIFPSKNVHIFDKVLFNKRFKNIFLFIDIFLYLRIVKNICI